MLVPWPIYSESDLSTATRCIFFFYCLRAVPVNARAMGPKRLYRNRSLSWQDACKMCAARDICENYHLSNALYRAEMVVDACV